MLCLTSFSLSVGLELGQVHRKTIPKQHWKKEGRYQSNVTQVECHGL